MRERYRGVPRTARAGDGFQQKVPLLESFVELATQMGYKKTTQKRETGVATLILLTAIRKIMTHRSRNAPGIRLPSNAKHPRLAQGHL